MSIANLSAKIRERRQANWQASPLPQPTPDKKQASDIKSRGSRLSRKSGLSAQHRQLFREFYSREQQQLVGEAYSPGMPKLGILNSESKKMSHTGPVIRVVQGSAKPNRVQLFPKKNEEGLTEKQMAKMNRELEGRSRKEGGLDEVQSFYSKRTQKYKSRSVLKTGARKPELQPHSIKAGVLIEQSKPIMTLKPEQVMRPPGIEAGIFKRDLSFGSLKDIQEKTSIRESTQKTDSDVSVPTVIDQKPVKKDEPPQVLDSSLEQEQRISSPDRRLISPTARLRETVKSSRRVKLKLLSDTRFKTDIEILSTGNYQTIDAHREGDSAKDLLRRFQSIAAEDYDLRANEPLPIAYDTFRRGSQQGSLEDQLKKCRGPPLKKIRLPAEKRAKLKSLVARQRQNRLNLSCSPDKIPQNIFTQGQRFEHTLDPYGDQVSHRSFQSRRSVQEISQRSTISGRLHQRMQKASQALNDKLAQEQVSLHGGLTSLRGSVEGDLSKFPGLYQNSMYFQSIQHEDDVRAKTSSKCPGDWNILDRPGNEVTEYFDEPNDYKLVAATSLKQGPTAKMKMAESAINQMEDGTHFGDTFEKYTSPLPTQGQGDSEDEGMPFSTLQTLDAKKNELSTIVLDLQQVASSKKNTFKDFQARKKGAKKNIFGEAFKRNQLAEESKDSARNSKLSSENLTKSQERLRRIITPTKSEIDDELQLKQALLKQKLSSLQRPRNQSKYNTLQILQPELGLSGAIAETLQEEDIPQEEGTPKFKIRVSLSGMEDDEEMLGYGPPVKYNNLKKKLKRKGPSKSPTAAPRKQEEEQGLKRSKSTIGQRAQLPSFFDLPSLL